MKMKLAIFCVGLLSGLMGCAGTAPPMDGEQEWLKPPTQRPSLMDVAERVDQLAPNPEKVRSPVLPVSWPPSSDDAQIFLSSVQTEKGTGVWDVFAPSHRVDLEILGEVQSIRGTGEDVVTPIGQVARAPQESLLAMEDAEEAMIHVLTGRMTPQDARPLLMRYLDWLEAAPHRSAYVSADAAGFIAWLRSSGE